MRVCFLLSLLFALSLAAGQDDRPLPQFTGTSQQAWINSPPVTTEALRGRVVLVEVWAFACGNCYRSAPWLNDLRQKFDAKAFTVIGIHTPEFDAEKKRANLEKSIRKLGVRHPVMMDNDYAYWKRLNNRYWPTFYLADKECIIRGVYIGETHAGDAQARAIERQIAELMTR